MKIKLVAAYERCAVFKKEEGYILLQYEPGDVGMGTWMDLLGHKAIASIDHNGDVEWAKGAIPDYEALYLVIKEQVSMWDGKTFLHYQKPMNVPGYGQILSNEYVGLKK